MNFKIFKSQYCEFINDYIKDIRFKDKLENFDTFNKRICSLMLAWNKNTNNIKRQMIETFNEVCLIHYLSNDSNCSWIYYEQEVGTSKRSIDIVTILNKKKFYLDIKTVHPCMNPKDIDKKWAEYEKAYNKYLKGEVTLFRDGFGPELWHNMIASRTKFIDYTKDLEDKIDEYNKPDDGYYFMVFCGNNFDWTKDELEDFVEYYLTGKATYWDHLREMSDYYITNKDIHFQHNIDNFTILFRDNISNIYNIIPFVRMDPIFRNYID